MSTAWSPDRRNKMLRVRITLAELDAAEIAAVHSGVSLSQFVRQWLKAGVESALKPQKPEPAQGPAQSPSPAPEPQTAPAVSAAALRLAQFDPALRRSLEQRGVLKKPEEV